MVNNSCYIVFNSEDDEEVDRAYSSLFEYYWLVKHISKQDPMVSAMVSIHEKWNRDYLDSLVMFPQKFLSKYGAMTREFIELFFEFYIQWGYYKNFGKAEEIGLQIIELLKPVKEFYETRKKEQEEQANEEENNQEDEDQCEETEQIEQETEEVESNQIEEEPIQDSNEEVDEDDEYSFEEPSDLEKFYNFLYPKYYEQICSDILDLTFKLNEYEDMCEKLTVLVYEGLGSMFSHVNDTEKAFTYFSKINVCGQVGELFIRAHLLNNIARYEEAYQLVKNLTKEEHFYEYILEYAFTLGMIGKLEELVEVMEVVLENPHHPLYERVKWISSNLFSVESPEKLATQFQCHGKFVLKPTEIVYATICKSYSTYYHSQFIIESSGQMLCDSDFYKSNPFVINTDQFLMHIRMDFSPLEIYRNITIDINVEKERVTYKFDSNTHLNEIEKNNIIQYIPILKSEGLRVMKYQKILVSDNLSNPLYYILDDDNVTPYFYENNVVLAYPEGEIKVMNMINGNIIYQGPNNISDFLDDLEEDSINHKLMFAISNSNDLIVFPQSGVPKTFSNLSILFYSGIYRKLIIDEKEYSVSYCYGYESIDGKYLLCEFLFDINEGSVLKKTYLNFQSPLDNSHKVQPKIFLEECKVIVFSHNGKTFFYNIEKQETIHVWEQQVELRVYSKYKDMVLVHLRQEKEAHVLKVETNVHDNTQSLKKLISIPVEDFIVRAKFTGDESIIVLLGSCALAEFDLQTGKLLGMFSFASTYGNVLTIVKHTPSKRRFLLYGDEMGIIYILELYKFD